MKTLQSSACNRLRVPFLVAGFFFIIQYGYSQASFRSIASGDWDSATTWEITSGTDGDNVPDGDDNVTIEAGHTITVGQPAFASSVTLDGDGGLLVLNADLTVGGDVLIDAPGVNATTNQITVGNFTLTIGGSLTINGANTNRKAILSIGSGLVDVKDNVTINNNANAEVSFVGNGRLRVAGVFTKGANSIFNVGTGTVELSGAAQTVPAINYHNLVLSGSGVKTLSAIAAGAWTLGGSLTLSGTVSTTTVDDAIINGDLNIGDGTTFTAAGFGLTVIGATNVGDGTSGTFAMATSVTGDKIFNGLITIATGATWNNPINEDPFIRGGITNNGTFNSGNATAIYTFDGSDQALTGTISIQAVTVTGITLTNNNSFTVVSFLNGTGTVRQAAGSTLTITGTSSSIGLDATTFTPNTVNYNGATQPIIGANYWDLNISGSGVKTWQAGTNSIGGNLTLSGTPTTTTTDNLAIHGNLNIGDGATLTAAGFNFSVSGTATIGAGTSGALNFISTAGTKTFLGLVTVNANGTWNNSGEDMTFEASIINNGNFNAGSGLYSFINNPQSLTGTFSIPNILVDGITLTNNGTVGVSTNLNGTGTWIQGGGTSLNIGSIISINTLDATAAGNTVQYSGGNQTVFPTTYNNLTIAQSSGQAFPGGDITVNGTLALNGGNFNLIGSNVLTLEASAAVTGTFSNTRMIIATSGSEVRKVFNAPGSFVFPIGDNTSGNDYSPITVTANAGTFGTPYIGVSVVDAKHPNNASATHFLSRYWNVTHTGITDVDIVATYITADVTGTEGSIKAAQLDGAFSQLTNPWVKDVALDEPNNELEFTGAVLTDGQTSVFTGITSTDPLVTINGGDVTICAGNSVALDASVTGGDPTIIYSWSPAAGLSATTIANPTASPTSTTTYTVTVRDGNGIVATESTTITVDQPPTSSNAGLDQNFCGTSVTLGANTPGVGSGEWTVFSGAGGSFFDQTDPGTAFTGVAGTTYVLHWTITNGVCASSVDAVQVKLDPAPTPANAGSDQTGPFAICGTSTALAGNTALVGTGVWSVVTGVGGSFVNANSPTTVFNGVAGTTYTLQWTISSGICTSSSDQVDIELQQPPTSSNAGLDQNFCGTSVTLGANTPGVGSGEWTVFSGAGGSFFDQTDPGTAFTGVAGTTYVLHWTITNGVCASSVDAVQVKLDPAPTPANAGSDQTGPFAICGTSTALAGNTALVGTGVWSVVTGVGGSFVNANSPTTVFNGVAGTTYTLQWTISSGICTSSSDQVDIELQQPPTSSNAGLDQNFCGTSVTLGANTPGVGSGEWTVFSGAGGSFFDQTDPGTAFTGVAGTTYVLHWTITNGVCASSVDAVQVKLDPAPTPANAGSDQTGPFAICGTSTALAGNTALVGTGVWSVVTGVGGSFVNANSPTTVFNGVAGTTYTLQWTISSGICTSSSDQVDIELQQPPTSSNAGLDQNFCGTSVTLGANTPGVGSGEWTVFSGAGGSFFDQTDPGTAFTGVAGTTYVLHWTITNGVCASSVDAVQVKLDPAPTPANAGSDQTGPFAICGTSTALAGNTALVGTGVWSVVTGVGGSFVNANSPTTVFNGVAGTTYTLQWTISSGICTSSSDQVDIELQQPPTSSNAGLDQNFCGTSVTLGANTPGVGSGEWTVFSGAGGSFFDQTDPGTAFTGVAGTTYVLHWTITNGVCASSVDAVQVKLDPAPTPANAGSDQTGPFAICGTSTALAGNTALVGTGVWSVVTGVGGSFVNANSPTTVFNGVAGTTYTLQWTISSGICTSSSDQVDIELQQPPTSSNAGLDQNFCGTSVTLGANTPGVGSGEWTVFSGAGGSFFDQTDPGTAFTGVAGTTYVLHWTITNGVCASSVDAVQVKLDPAPTPANAGSDQTGPFAICGTSTALAGNTALVGTGVWSVVTGVGGSFVNANSPTTVFNGVAGTTYTLQWTISSGICTSSSDQVDIELQQPPTSSNAGLDQNFCGTSVTLGANTPGVGSGEWTVFSGAGGSFFDQTDPGTAFTGVAGTTYVLHWTITNGVCASSVDAVQVKLDPAPTPANAGSDQTGPFAICGTSTALAGNTALVGTGVWSVVTGVGGSFVNANSPTTVFNGVAGTTYTLQWTISSGICTSSSDQVDIELQQPPTSSNAGLDQNFCGTSVTLGANTPGVGSGEWTVFSGAGGSFFDQTDPGTAFTGVAGTTYVLHWTITNGVCASSVDAVQVKLDPAPTPANAGSDQTGPFAICGTSTALAGNTALVGTGVWSVVTGVGGSFVNANSPTTVFNGVAGTTYTLQWTISSGICTSSSDQVDIELQQPPTSSNAGLDQNFCGTSVTLGANTPGVGSGEWTVFSGAGGSFFDQTDPGTAFTGVAGTTYVLHWTITNGVCASSVDAVQVKLDPAPTPANAGSDQTGPFAICGTSTALAGNTALVGTGVWSVVTGVGGSFVNANSPTTVFNGVAGTTYTLQWTISSGICTSSSDQVDIELQQPPTSSNAGLDQNFCGTSVTLGANTPGVGSGEWTVFSGAGGSFFDQTDPGTAFTGVAGTTYVLHWTITNGVCASSVDAVQVKLDPAPTPANAGSDQTGPFAICGTSTALAGNTALVGTGVWSVVTGVGGSFVNANSPTTVFNGVAGTTYTLQWTISSGICTSSSDQVDIELQQPPTSSNAGLDQNFCGTSVTLGANTPGVGSGEWTVFSGAGGSFFDQTDPGTAFTGVAGTTYVLHWTITNGVCASSVDAVQVKLDPAPTPANAGSDQTGPFAICGTSTALAGNTALVGTGVWSVVTGVGGSFVNANSPTTVFNGVAGTTYTLQWTISSGICTSSSDQVDIELQQPPTSSNAGLDQNFCGTSVTLGANTPGVGSGEWTVFSGAGGSFFDQTDPGTAFTGVAGTTYVLHWTITNGVCASSVDDVQVKLDPAPTPANAGSDQTGPFAICGTSTALAGNTALVGTGVWSVVTGVGGSFVNANSPTTVFNGVAGTTYTLQWTISSGICTSSSDQVDIELQQPPTSSNAGLDQNFCGTSVTLGANTPGVGSGEWTVFSGAGGSFFDQTDPGTAFTGVAGTTYVLHWTITNGVCASSVDAVQVKLDPAPTPANAGSDQTGPFAICGTSTALAGNTALVGTGVWSVVTGVGGSFVNANSPTTVFNGVAGTTYTLQWTISSGICTSSSDQVDIELQQPPTSSNAGLDQNFCGTSVTLGANTPGVGSGEWTVFSGAGGSFFDQTDPGTAFTGVAGTTYVLHWTITNGVCASSVDAVQVKLDPAPTPANAGSDQTGPFAICGTSTALAGNTALVGTGVWSVVTGVGGSFVNANSPTTVFNGVAGTTYTLQWTISSGICTSSSDQVDIELQQPPTSSNAGLDQNFCGTSVTLGANTPGVGSGEWTVFSGAGGSFFDQTDPGTAFTGVAGTTYVLHWTITNGVCASSVDAVQVKLDPAPTPANAGSDQTGPFAICGTSTALAGNTALVGTGVWSVVTGVGGSFVNANSPTTVFNGVAGTTYTLQWTISSGICTSSSDQVDIELQQPPTSSNAGLDQNFCGTSVTLGANTPGVGSGEWTVFSGAGGSFFDQTDPGTAFTGVAGTTYVLHWTITNGVCASSVDAVQVKLDPAPTPANAGSDQTGPFAICGTSTALAGNTALVGTGVWSVVTGVGGSFVNANSPTTVFNGVAGTTYTLQWTISSGICTSSSDQVDIELQQPPTSSNAGLDQNFCGTSVTLGANTPGVGSGEWTVFSGAGGSFFDQTDPGTAFTGVAGTTYVLHWTITNGVCASSVDAVQVKLDPAPTPANAGSDQTGPFAICGTSTALAGNTALVGTGVWSVVTGVGGSFVNANSPTTVFNGVAGTTYTLQWTISSGICTSSSDQVDIELQQPPTSSNAGLDQNFCGTSVTLGANTPGVGSGEWTVFSGAGGSFFDQTDPGTAFTGVAGTTYVLHWTITNGVCASSVDDVMITFPLPASVDAGSNAETCEGIAFNFNTQSILATASNYSSILWTHTGTGTLFNANTLTPTYQPGAGELGLVNFTIEANGITPCPSVNDLMTLTITQSPVVNAGSDGETCQGVSYNFNTQDTPATAANYFSILWTVAGGTGVLTNANTLTPTYTPGVGETGAKTFTLTAVGNGSCASVNDQMILVITPSPIVSAGSNAETCQGVSYNFNTQSTPSSAANYLSILWTTLGSGTLSDANTLTPTYAPGIGETGNVIFTLTATGNGSCTNVSNQMTLMITPSPAVNAGSDAETCQGVSYNFNTQTTPAIAANYFSILWTTLGTGVLNNANTLTPSYTPGASETGNVSFTLTAVGNGSCASVNDQMTLTITPLPTVNAGSNAETCQGVTYNFNTQSVPAGATNYASLLWTHSGTGILFNANTLTPTYQPGPTEAGNVTFTLTVTGNGSCVDVTGQMTLVITPLPTISAGSDSETCQGVAFNFSSQLTGATGSNYSSLLWTNSVGATGVLTNANTLTPTYTPGIGETGTVTFTLTANGNGSCVPVNDVMVLTITPATIVDAGSDEEICQGGTYNFSNQSILASASNFSSLAWTHDGAGTLFNGNTLTPTYFATPGETGVRTFTLKAFPNGTCSSTNSTMLLTITPAPVANAGSDDAVCEGTPTFDFSTRFTVASIANGTLAWTHNGAGFLSSNTVLNPVYTVGAGDFGNTVTFTLTVTSGSTVCAAAVDQFLLQVNRTALVSVPNPSIVVCEPAQINLSGSFGGSASSGAWSLLAGGGTLSVSSITGVNVTAVYDTVSTDVSNTLQFRLTTNDPDGAGPCTTVFVNMNVTIDRSAKVFAGNDFAVCEYDNINLHGSFSGSTTSVVWSGGSGAPQFGDVTSPITTYNLTPAERAANGHIFTFTLTTDDPAGVCPSVSDQVRVTVNDTLNFVTFTGLDVVYQEDDQTETLVGVPGGGVFTGPGIVAGTAVFNPANANIGTNHIKYTYTDPLTGCLSAPRASTIVNPVTTIDFRVLVSVSPDVFAAEDVNGFPQICSDIGDIRLRGIPDVNDPLAGTPTEFSSPQPTLDTRIIQKPDGFYYIVTDGLPAGVYNIIYTYTNEFGATTFFQKLLTVYSSPRAIIDVSNSCVSSELNFTESSVVTGSNPTGATITDWVWNFGNGIGSSTQEPFYQYPVPGNYNVVLQVTTSEGCKHDTLKAIRVGPTPTMNFVWSAFCNGNDTKFVDATNPGISTITEYTWEFSDGFTLTGPAGAPVPAGTNGGRTSGTYTNPNHRYDTFGQYDVKLTVSTNDGCVNDTTKRAFILSYGTPSPTAGYFENFESGPGTWVGTRADISIPTDTSWVFGLPGGTVINSASSGTNAWWTGRNTNTIINKSTYFANEKSAVIGPCINLSNIKRPMISIDYWSDSEDGRDGAVVQFSTNGGVTWQTIGNDAGAGLRWYDGRALTGNPGLQPLGQFGWSTSNYTTGGWKTARYNLDQIPKVDREEVIFRVAFGSNNDNQFNDPLRTIEYSGFAFDNVFIGEKQRNVLVEYFTNAGINPSANDYLNNLYSNQFVLKDSSDFFKIQYHIANPSADVINQGNPVDPAARSLFYGISQPPVGIMDGVLGNYFGTVFNGDQTKINATEVDRRALESPLFDIEVNELAASADSISLAVQFEYIDAATPLNTPVTFLVGLVESNVSGNINVLRKMLLGSEGKTVNIPWTLGTATTVPVKSIIDVPIGIANNNLWIVAFVQDRNTKRIHQSVMVKASQKSEATVVGVEDPVLEGANRIEIFPNPASRQLNFTSEHRLMEGYTYTIVDQRGVAMLKGELREDIFTPQQVELNNLTNGVYFVIISRGGRALVHRKIAVMNQR